MKLQKTLLLFSFLLFVNILLQAQNTVVSKYQGHPITSFNINFGLNYTAAVKGAISPGYVLGVDFEHQFKSSPFGFNVGFRYLVLGVKNQDIDGKFLMNELFGKLSYRITNKLDYMNIGYSRGQIFEEEGYFPGLERTVHFFNLGFEHKFLIPEKLVLSAGINYKLTNIYDIEFGSLNIIELVFRFGKN